ncbi:translation initiation factor IF-2 [Schistocerca cancellata]|uniref:translation initiation factor IF-2 n=1 Tax=Schistocerca cancellata TaxID=274614 RepID=UPI002118D7E4|nr:translation initiation factor IF-2 [Schistocerca cancellata]
MRTAMALMLCVVVAATAPLQSLAFPQRAMMFSGYFGRPVPAQYYPRTYGRPGFVTRGYEPQGAMSAFAAGNTVAAGSGFYGGADGNGNGNGNGIGYANGNGNGYNNGNGYSNGNGAALTPDCSQCNGVVPPPGASAEQPEPEAEPESQPQPLPEADPAPAPAPGSQEEPGVSQEQPALPPPSAEADDADFPSDQPATPAPVAPPASAEVPEQESGRDFSHKHEPKPASKPGRKRPAQDSADDDDDDDDEDDFPVAGLPLPGKRRKGQGGFYSSYFPMFFGGFPGGRSSGGGADGTPGVATAIANSYSTGKGAVATSHATAYGGPHLLGASGSNGYRKNGSKARLTSRA